ncbi:hypothetical protein GNI_051610, partial [Gregarina niphandrodes]
YPNQQSGGIRIRRVVPTAVSTTSQTATSQTATPHTVGSMQVSPVPVLSPEPGSQRITVTHSNTGMTSGGVATGGMSTSVSPDSDYRQELRRGSVTSLTNKFGSPGAYSSLPSPTIREVTVRQTGYIDGRHSPLAGYPVLGGHPRLQRPPGLHHEPYSGFVIPEKLTLDYARQILGSDLLKGTTPPRRNSIRASSKLSRRLSETLIKSLNFNSTCDSANTTRDRALLTHNLHRTNDYPNQTTKLVYQDPRRPGCCCQPSQVVVYTNDSNTEQESVY